MLYGAGGDREPDILLVTRKCRGAGASCLRIVDIIGDYRSIPQLSQGLLALLRDEDCEYADLCAAGLERTVMEEALFTERHIDSSIVIPHYFEPYEKKNVDLYYGYKTVNPEVPKLIFKADADQDRPNV